jgi:hypothetical protein
MKHPIRDEKGFWYFVNADGDRISPRFNTEELAWHWYDNQEDTE